MKSSGRRRLLPIFWEVTAGSSHKIKPMKQPGPLRGGRGHTASESQGPRGLITTNASRSGVLIH